MRRVRKTQALLVALAVMTGILATAVPALAAPSSTARLTVGQQVFPGLNQPYSIQVTNSGLPIAGETINAVRILLPTQATGVKNGAALIVGPGSWTATRVSNGNLQSILFKGGTIAPGGNVVFTFPADVPAPTSSDRSGVVQVQVSSNGGATTSNATVPAGSGTLTTAVKILEVTTIAPTSPAGVTDGTGTAGQPVVFTTSIKNHATNAVLVDPTLTASGTGSNETVTDQAPATIASGATSSFDFPVTLGTTGSGDRTATFTGGGSAAGAVAAAKSTNLVIQVAPVLTPRLGTLSPRTVRPTTGTPIEYTFTINVDKTGTPGLTIGNGSSLDFAGNSVPLQSAVPFAGGAATQTLTFGPAAISGADGVYDADLVLVGADANDKAISTNSTLTNAITIDSILPVITAELKLPNDNDGDPQTAAKNGDVITVSGQISDNIAATIDFVELRSNAGDVINVPVNVSGGEYTGSTAANFSNAATSFVAAAQATDSAGNRGMVESTPALVDLFAPTLLNPGDVLSATTIRVQLDDAAGLVKGGCNPSEWEVDGALVTSVRFSDGTSCSRGFSGSPVGPDNYRLLVLGQAIDEAVEPAVTYTPGARFIGDRAKDGAGNYTVATLIDTVSRVAPAAPDILSVTRNGGTETATFNEDKYWTRFGGNDLEVNFAGARDGYRIQVLDGNDEVLYTSDSLVGSTGTVAIPIGTTEGDYARKIRLLSSRAVPGATTPLTIALDTTAPAISTSVVALASDTEADQIAVTLSEPLGGGTNFSFDWYAYEMAGGERSYYVVDRVTGSGNTLTVEAALPNVTAADSSAFGGVDYIFTSGDSGGKRYVDRAGNALGDTTAF
ncbi:MAG: hypothetical protein GEU71_02515 [Actinobacteria bacterium]|nr:hypothetical protein [Actinomycetota bacterium]